MDVPVQCFSASSIYNASTGDVFIQTNDLPDMSSFRMFFGCTLLTRNPQLLEIKLRPLARVIADLICCPSHECKFSGIVVR